MNLTPRQALEGRIKNDARNVKTCPGWLLERAVTLCAWSLLEAIDMQDKELERRATQNLRKAVARRGYPTGGVLSA